MLRLKRTILFTALSATLALGQQVTQPSAAGGGGGATSVTAPAVIGKGQLVQGQDGARGIAPNTSDLGVVKLTKGVPSAAASTDLSDSSGLARGAASLTNAGKVPVVGSTPGTLAEGPMSCDAVTGTCTIPTTVFGPKTIGAGASQLPAAASCSGCITIVTDALTAGSATGGGSAISLLRSNGSAWVALGGGGGAAASTDLTDSAGLVRGAAALTTNNKLVEVSTTDGTIQEVSNQTANYIYSGPVSGGAAAPAFRALVSADIPANAANTSGKATTAGAAATVALTGTNTIAGGTALVVTAAGSGYTSAPTSSTAGNGTATCSGTAVIATAISVADPGGASAYLFNPAAALTFPAPVGVAGVQRCYRNATGGTGVITIKMAASNTVDVDGANGSSAGTLVSGGAVGDAACIVSDAANHWYAYVQKGTWTNN
jgi:hypothetical protein